MLGAIVYLYLLLQVLNLLLMSALPSQKLSYVGMIDITASLEVGSLPKGKGLIRNQVVDSLNSSKKKDFASLESLCCSNPGIVHIVESFLVTFLD
jgi:hypothetical protein